jgi:transglycosylase-like protein with SLT domain
MIAFGAAVLGLQSVERYFQDAITNLSATARAANLLGVSAPVLQAFRLLIQQTGGNADTATGSLQKLQQTMQGFQTGLAIPSSDFLLGLSYIGGKQNDSALTILEKYAAWTQGKSGPRALQVGNLLGFDQDTINAAVRLGPELARAMQAAQLNAPSAQGFKNIQDLQTALGRLSQALLGVANMALGNTGPALSHLADQLDGADGRATKLSREFGQLEDDVGGIGKAFAGLGAVLNELGVGGAFGKFFDFVLGELHGMMMWIKIIIDGLTAAGTGLGLLASGNAKGAVDAMSAWWNSAVKTINDADNGKFGAGQPTGPPAPSGSQTVLAQPRGQGAPASSIPAHSSAAKQQIVSMIRAKAVAAGFDPDVLVAIAYRESSFDPTKKAGINPKTGRPWSSAGGLFGFLDPRHGSLGFDKFDPEQATDAAIRTIKQTLANVERATGAAYVRGDEELANFLGQSDMIRFLRADPTALARSVAPRAAASNPTIFQNRTVAQVEALLRGMVTGRVGAAAGSHASTHHVHIGKIEVHTAATDAKGVSKHIRRALTNELAQQGNSAQN